MNKQVEAANKIKAEILGASDVPTLDKCRADIETARKGGMYAGDRLYLLNLATRKEQELATLQTHS